MIAEGQFPNDCSLCAKSSQLRDEWGCDSKTSKYDNIDCPVCRNKPGYSQCTICHGRGNYPIIGCPNKMITADACLSLELYSHYKNHFLPESGGVLDQSNKTMLAINFIAKEYDLLEEDDS